MASRDEARILIRYKSDDAESMEKVRGENSIFAFYLPTVRQLTIGQKLAD